MSIWLGYHCWYCEHGPCNEGCHENHELDKKVVIKKLPKKSKKIVIKTKKGT